MTRPTEDTTGTGAVPPPSSIRRIALAASIGTAIDWFDFFLFGTAAALVFGELFFPQFDPLVGTLAAFSTFAVGFISRPLGGAIFGHLGDKLGRKNVLVVNLAVMGVATFMIGLLPTYATAGIWAPILLVILRFAQGFGIGGEYGGAMSLVAEHAPHRSRGFWGSWVEAGAPIGLVLSTLTLLAGTAFLTTEQLLAWGWRIPFLASVVLVGVGLVIRLRISETPSFSRVQDEQKIHKMPLVNLFREYSGQVVKAIGIWLGVTVTFYIGSVFLVSYGTTQLGLSRPASLGINVVASLYGLIICVLAGTLSDRFGRRRVAVVGGLWMAVSAFPVFALIDTGSPLLIFLGTAGLLTGTFLVAGLVPAFYSEMFDTRVRSSGVSVSIAVATLVGGSVTPTLATALVLWSAGSSWGVSVFVVVVGAVTAFSAHMTRKTYEIVGT